jgi:argininosuccinate lyase
MKFAPEYVTCVLNENFEDAKAQLLAPMMAINYAHLVMLAAQGIISAGEARTLRDALDSVSQDAIRKVTYDGTYEDLFFYVERLVIQACSDDVAGRLHTARSRNDIDMTMYRMRQRELVLSLLAATFALRRSLLDLADRHRNTILAVHTHTQRAQPSTVAHYLLAVVEQLERDAGRLKAAFASTNRNPLGACAITGTGFPIDRALTSSLLGFSGPTCNTYGSIATVDYLLESTSAATVMLTGHGRFVQDMLLWSTAEFGYLRLGDGYVQGSSIMPQKRNPVALEPAHAIAAHLVGGRQRNPDRGFSELLVDASSEILGRPLNYSEPQLTHILSPRHFVEIRTTFGGPAPEETARAAKVSRALLDADQEWWTSATDALEKAERTLADCSAAL